MQTEMHLARSFLLEQLHNAAGVIAAAHDDSDFVLAEYYTGQQIMFYIVEQPISAHELRRMLEHHSRKGWYTLLLFWADMLLPQAGELFSPQPWMEVLLPLYGGKLYGFDVYREGQVGLFPVYFQAQVGQAERLIRYGHSVDFDELRYREVEAGQQSWKIGYFGLPEAQADEEKRQQNSDAPLRGPLTLLQVHYEVLGVAADADLSSIKKAYRERARQLHPDLNSAPDAHARMQQLNEAYAALVQNLIKKPL